MGYWHIFLITDHVARRIQSVSHRWDLNSLKSSFYPPDFEVQVIFSPKVSPVTSEKRALNKTADIRQINLYVSPGLSGCGERMHLVWAAWFVKKEVTLTPASAPCSHADTTSITSLDLKWSPVLGLGLDNTVCVADIDQWGDSSFKSVLIMINDMPSSSVVFSVKKHLLVLWGTERRHTWEHPSRHSDSCSFLRSITALFTKCN